MPILTTLGAACAKAWGFTSGLVKDQYFNLVSLLLPGNGTNGAQNNTFLDSSTNNFTITRNGNTTQGTFSPFSQTGWGNYFSGSNYIYISNTSVFDLPGDFTIEFWWYPLTLSATIQSVCGKWGTSQFAWLVQATSTSLTLLTGPAPLTTITNSWSPVNGRWYHIAFTRSGTDVRAFVNGSQIGTTQTSSKTCSSTANMGIGANPDGPQEYSNSYISNFRITKGQALYTSAFTPSVIPITTTSQGATAGNVSILTCQSNRFIDNSTNNLTVNPVGGVSVVAFSPFAPTAAYTTAAVGGSGYFDGTGDYLTGPANAAFAQGTGDFTVEAWVFPTGNGSSSPSIFDCRVSGNEAGGFILGLNTSYTPIFYTNALLLTGSKSCVLNAWNHLALTRSSNTVTLWLNGESIGTVANSTNFTTQGCYVGMAYTGVNNPFMGYMATLRVVKGTAVYTAAFTPPTAPLTAITNTSLLLNFTNAGITDATAKNDLETVGNTQISTTQSKWGGGSMYFDGTGDWLVIPSSNLFILGTGDFTIEAWGYPSAVGGGGLSKGLFQITSSAGFSTSATNSLAVATTNPSGNWGCIAANAFNNSSTAAVVNTWYHLALVRNSGTTKLYVNGTSVLSFADTTNYTCTFLTIGGYYDTNNIWNGYIDDFRVTKGYARYTSNFTPPSAPFPVQ